MIIRLKNEKCFVKAFDCKLSKSLDYQDFLSFKLPVDEEIFVDDVVGVRGKVFNENYRVKEIISRGNFKDVFCEHVFFDCKNVVIPFVDEAVRNGASFNDFSKYNNISLICGHLNRIMRSKGDENFQFSFDFDGDGVVACDNTSLYDLIFGEFGILNTFRCKVVYHNYMVKFVKVAPFKNTELLFHENKNISEMAETVDFKNIVTKLFVSCKYTPSSNPESEADKANKRRALFEEDEERIRRNEEARANERARKREQREEDYQANRDRPHMSREELHNRYLKNLDLVEQKIRDNSERRRVARKRRFDERENNRLNHVSGKEEKVFRCVFSSPLIDVYDKPYEASLDFSSDEIDSEEALVVWCKNNLFTEEDSRDVPVNNFSFKPTSDDYDVLLNDKAFLVFNSIGARKVVRCCKIEYDPLCDKYISIEFGSLNDKVFKNAIGSLSAKVDKKTESIKRSVFDIDKYFEDYLEKEREALEENFNIFVNELKAEFNGGIEDAIIKAEQFSGEVNTDINKKILEFKSDNDKRLDEFSKSIGSVEDLNKELAEKFKNDLAKSISSVNQRVDDISLSVKSLDGDAVKKSEVKIDDKGISLGVGKNINGKVISSLLTVDEDSIDAITKKMRITGDLIVGGSISGRHIASGSIDAGKIKAGSIESYHLSSESITADKLKVDTAFIKRILSDETFRQEFEDGEATTQNIFAKMRDNITSSIRKGFITKDETRKLINDLTIGADGIRQITQDESKKVFKNNVVAFKNDINNDIDSKIKSSDEKLRNEIGSSIGNVYDDLIKKNYDLEQKQDKDIQSLRGDVDKRIDDNRRELNVKMNAMRHNFEEGAQDLYDFWKKSSDDINNELKNVDGKIAGAVNEMNGKAEKLAYDINKSAGNLRSEFNKNIDDKTGVLRSDINSNASKIDVNIKKIELIERDTKKFREFSSTIDEFKSKIGEIEKNKFEITTESKNLCAETGETKHGNDLDFNTTETLKAGKEYYILAEADCVKGSDQWTKIYNANLKQLDIFDANYRLQSGKILVNGLNVWKVSYDHDVTHVNIWPCGSDTYISKVRIYEASKSEDKKNLYVSHNISSPGSNGTLKKIEFRVSEKLEYGEIYAIEFNSGVQFKYHIVNNYSNFFDATFISNGASSMTGENGYYFEEKNTNGTFYVTMLVTMSEDAELKLYGDVKIYKSNIKNTTKSGFDVINEISSQIRQTQSEIDLTVKKNDVIHRINVSPEGTKIHGGAIVDVLEGKEIVGGVIRGNYRMEIGDTGYMYPCYNYDVSGLVMKIPHKGGNSGIVCQFNGNPKTQAAGEFNYYPLGLYIYRCENNWERTKKNDSYILHVDGFVNARGVGGLRFTKENDGANNLWCIGSFQDEHKSVRLEFGGGGNDIYYQSSDLRYSLWKAMTNALSDVRYKTNIKKSDVNCLDIVNNINFYSFDWAKGKDPCKKKEPFKVGMIAQEVESIDKDFVYDNDGVKFVDTYRMLNIALKAIQELSGKVARLESECKGA